MNKLTTRLTAMLLSGMLVIGSAPGTVFAADPGQAPEYEEIAFEVDAAEESSEGSSEAAEEIYFEEVTPDAAEDSSDAVEEAYPEGAGASEEEAARYYTVTLDANGGYFENEWDDAVGDYTRQAAAITRLVPVGETVAAFPVFAEAGQEGQLVQTMVFAGWSLEPGGELITAGEEAYAPVDHCTLYAVWEACETVAEEGAGDEGAGQETAGDETVEDTQEDPEATTDPSASEDESAEEFVQDDAAYEDMDDAAYEDVDDAAYEEEYSEYPAPEDRQSEEDADAEGEDSDAYGEYYDTGVEPAEDPDANSGQDTDQTDPETDEGNDPTETGEETAVDDEPVNTEDTSGREQEDTRDTQEAVSEKDVTTPAPARTAPGKTADGGAEEPVIIEEEGEEESDRTDAVMGEEANGQCGNDLFWTLDEEGTLTISGTGEMYNNISWSDLLKNEIRNVIIEDGVTGIGDYAFRGFGNLNSISIPYGVTRIGMYAFAGCTCLTNILIPDGVTSIAGNTFDGCTSLTSVTLPYTVTNIRDFAFYNCIRLSSILIPSSVDAIGDYVFLYKNDTTGSIEQRADIIIKGHAGTKAENYANSKGMLFSPVEKSGSIGTNLTWTLDNEGILTVTGRGDMEDMPPWWDNAGEIKSVIIGAAVTSIGNNAFDGCSSLESITIPNSVTSIGYAAFGGCSSLENIEIPASVTSIGDYAFDGCSSLESITIPNSVTSIGYAAFGGCSSLENIEIPASVTSIGYRAFSDCSSLTSITIPDSVTSIGDIAFDACPDVHIHGNPGSYVHAYAVAHVIPIVFPTPVSLTVSNITISDINSQTYTGEDITPSLAISYNGIPLKENTDYTLSYSNNTAVGTETVKPTVTITGKGNYTGSISRNFTINAASITNATVSGISNKTYTGSAQTQNSVVKVGDRTLTEDTDYTVSYANNINAGTATVKITGEGNYTGTVSKNFTIASISIANATVSGISNKTYTGSALTQNPTVKVGSRTLTKDTDYTLSYSNNTNVGTETAKVTITGKGNYTGTISKNFTISTASIANATVSGISNKTYTGSALTQNPTVKVGDKTLTKGTDYTLSYANNTNAGTAAVTITGKGNYTGTVSKNFTISVASIANATVSGISNKTYTGSALTQNPAVKVGDKTLTKGTDYTLSYANNTNAGTAAVTITGKGNYTGTVSKNFTISAASIANATVSGISNKTYTGSALTQSPTVKVGDRTLTKGTDYTLSYSNNTNAGTATVTFTGKGNYTGTVSKNFTISGASIANATVSGISNKTYTGSALTQSPTVKVGDKTLTKGTDYTLSYANNTNAGTATVTITGKGNYSSKKTTTFKINKAAQSITAAAKASSVAVGKTTTVSITGARGTKSFKSSDTTIATVNASTGVVTAKKVGTVKITATSAATANYNAASKTVTIKVVPAATSSLTAANQAKGIKLAWKKVTGANGYKVYRGSTLIKTITSGSTVAFTDTAANTNGTKYTYKVVAKASTGDSTLSKSIVYYNVARPAVSSVTNSAASKMTVKWGKNAKATGYQIQYSTSKTFDSGNKTVKITKNSTVSKAIGSLTKGKTYYVRIRTYKTVGDNTYISAWSGAKGVKIVK